jgi:hypothetical protein
MGLDVGACQSLDGGTVWGAAEVEHSRGKEQRWSTGEESTGSCEEEAKATFASTSAMGNG